MKKQSEDISDRRKQLVEKIASVKDRMPHGPQRSGKLIALCRKIEALDDMFDEHVYAGDCDEGDSQAAW